jgi:phosphoglycolate phosphatase
MLVEEKYILWDWNGTLLDDTEICLSAMNKMLAKRKMNLIDLDCYKEVFGFPVVDYYKSIGFDFQKESFESVSVEFIDLYNNQSEHALLMPDCLEVLNSFKNTGKINIVLSAMQQEMLIDLIDRNGLSSFFTDILGIDNIYAHSKSAVGKEFVKANNIAPQDVLLIGDTLHDFEVASEIGCRCILVANGHQSEERLISSGAIVIKNLHELLTEHLN